MKKNLNILRPLILAVGIMLMGSSCTKYNDPAAVFEDYDDIQDTSVKRKVLFISIDGAVGQEIKKIMPTHIASLLKTSKYTFEAIANDNTKDAATWMSMMSGVTYDMHQIEDNSYIPKPNENDPHHNAAGYPSILYRMATLAPGVRKMAVVRDKELSTKLLVSADEGFDVKSDEEVKNQMIKLLTNKNPDFSIVQFKDVLDAGVNTGFSASSASYTSAVKKVDGYIGEIVAAVKARKNYEKEEWLVIVTSNHGGTGKEYGGSSYEERNTFVIFQHLNFKEAELTGKAMSYVRLWGYNGSVLGTSVSPVGVRAVSEDIGNSSDYDLATTKELTISARMRFNLNNTIISSTYSPNTYNYWYSSFFGKDSNTSTATPGWNYYTYGNDLEVHVSDGSKVAKCSTSKINGEWYTMTTVITAIAPDKVNIKVFNNGTLSNETTTDGMNINNIKTNDPLIFGYRPSISYDLVDFDASEVQIFNKAYKQEEIRDFLCYTGNLSESSYGPNLKGFWKMSPTSSGQVKNEVAGKGTLQLSGAFSGKSISEVKPCEVGANAVLVQSQDYFTQIFYWLELQAPKEWKLQGQVFLNKYEEEFLKP